MKAAFVSLGFTGTPESQFEAADGYLIAKDLRLIPDLIQASRSARRIIVLNLLISLIYNLVAIVLVMNGSIGPILCAIFMPLSSLTVIGVAYLWPLFRN
jgi:cation transport ATPase